MKKSRVEPTQTELYEIQDGVRRAKAAHQSGKTVIQARIADGAKLGPVVELPIESLRSPKTIIETDGAGFSRWRKVLRAVETGRFPKGESVPPIEVQRGTRGVPIQDVQVEGIDD